MQKKKKKYSVHIRTQINIDPVHFTFSPENYATFAWSWTVISLCDLFWYDCYRYQRCVYIKAAFVYVLEIQDYARLIEGFVWFQPI